MWLVVIALLCLGFIFLMREAEATEWIRKRIAWRAEQGRNWKEIAEIQGFSAGPRYFARFLDALLECAPCVAAWASVPSIALYYAVERLNDMAAALVILCVVGPVCAVGLLYAFTLLSPAQAMAAALAGLAKFKQRDERSKDGGPGATKEPTTGC